jgi:HEAT repeat protein
VSRALRWGLGGGLLAVAGLSGWVLGTALEEAREAGRRADGAFASAGPALARVERAEERLRKVEAALLGLMEAEERALDALRKDGAAQRDRVEDLERSLGALLADLEGLRREIAAARGPSGPTPGEEEELLRRLDLDNPGARFEAIWRLQRGKGEAARRAAVKGLADPEDSIRYQAALLARDLRVAEAVPLLVERLSDGSAAVRSGAIEALKAVEGTDLGFDPLEPDVTKRAEAVLRWKERVRGR